MIVSLLDITTPIERIAETAQGGSTHYTLRFPIERVVFVFFWER